MEETAGLPPYRLDDLGWLQFERLCALVLEREAGLTAVSWRGRADQGRVALVDADLVLEHPAARLGRPCAWPSSGCGATPRPSAG